MNKVLINISVITATILSFIATSLPVIATDINKSSTKIASNNVMSADLYWYQHDGWKNGSERWKRKKVGRGGWEAFKSVFATSNGIIYAIDKNGDLYWYSHDGWKDGDGPRGPSKQGEGRSQD